MTHDAKARLRREMIERRLAIDVEERATLDRRIQDALLASPRWRAAERVMAYHAMLGEVGTSRILEAAIEDGKRLALPRCVPGERRFEAVEINDPARDLAPGPFRGLLEPAAHLPALTDPDELDLIVVPGVAFDRRGYRLGYGGGMFDRFLAACPSPHRLAVAYALKIVDRVPTDPHDLPVHAILTEDGVAGVRGEG